MKSVYAVAVFFSLLVACGGGGGSADAGTGISQAEFDAYKSATEARIAALERVVVKVSGGGSAPAGASGLHAMSASPATSTQPLGAFLGYGGPVVDVQRLSMKSVGGYLYTIVYSAAQDGVTYIVTSQNGVYFASSDCSGQGIIPSSDVGPYGAAQGVVFRVGAQDGTPTDSYLYIAAGSELLSDQPVQTHLIAGGCEVISGGSIVSGYAALVNDPAVTGVDSRPIALPLSMD